MTNPAPLSVDPEQLGLAGDQLLTSAAQLPTAPAPFLPVGSDPLSVAIIEQIPAVDGPPMTELPLVQAQSTTTARNVVGAAKAYASTDQQLGGQIGKEMQNLSGAPGTGSGGAGSMGQMMSTPMQMASQMADAHAGDGCGGGGAAGRHAGCPAGESADQPDDRTIRTGRGWHGRPEGRWWPRWSGRR